MTTTTIIGIGGASCGGKTTLTNGLIEKLSREYNIRAIINDKHFWPEDSPNHILIPEINHFNWDILSSVDWDSFTQEKDQILEEFRHSDKPTILILEGHLVLNYRPIADICHRKFCITMDKETCLARRSLRVYDPPDVPGFFDGCVWPMYEKYLHKLQTQYHNIVYVDGTQSKETILKFVLDSLNLGSAGTACDRSP